MIAFLIVQNAAVQAKLKEAAPNAKIIYSKPTSANACFDLKYQEEGKDAIGTTHNNEGFFVGYRLYDNEDNILQTNLVKHTEEYSQTDTIKIKFSTEYEELFPTYLKVVFNVSNSDYFSKKIDLGVFADSDFNGDTKTKISETGGKLGYAVTGDNLHYSYFVKNFLDHISVNKTYFGTVSRQENGEFLVDDIPFFKSKRLSRLGDVDTMFAFSWTGITIPPESYVLFEVTFAPNDNVDTPSVVTDETEYPFYSQYVQFNFKAVDANYGQEVELIVTINDQKYTKSHTFTEDEPELEFPIEYTIPNGVSYITLTAYATDKGHTWASNKINKKISLALAPYIDSSAGSEIKGPYRANDVISFKVRAYTFLIPGKIKYRFDNGRVETFDKVLKVENEPSPPETDEQLVQCEIPIPPRIAAIQGFHNLNIWVENDIGQSSKENPYEITKTIQIVNDPPPEINETGFSVEAASASENIIGYAVIKAKAGSQLKLYIRFNEGVEKLLGRYQAKSDDPTPYGFFYQIPDSAKSGRTKVIFVVEDQYRQKVEFNSAIKIK